MEKLLLVGAGEFGRVIIENASQHYDYAVLHDEDAKAVDDISKNGSTADKEKPFPEYNLFIVTTGNNGLKEKLYNRTKIAGYSKR